MIPVPANTVSNAEKEALAEFARELAKEMNVSNDVDDIVSKIRWYPNKAGAVVIVRKGENRKVLATISPKSGKWSHLYPSWERVLAELAARKEAERVSRMSHDGMEPGKIPLAER